MDQNKKRPLFQEREVWMSHLGQNIGFERTGKESKIKFYPEQTGEVEVIEFVLKKEKITELLSKIKDTEQKKLEDSEESLNPKPSDEEVGILQQILQKLVYTHYVNKRLDIN